MVGRSLMQPEEVAAILDIIPQSGAVLEIGTFQGVTVSQWAEARPGVTFYSVDPMRWRRAGLKWYENRKDNMRLLTGTVDDLIALGVVAAFDVIVIDGDHSYEACRHDLEASLVLSKPGGLWVVHDYAKGTLRRTMARGVVRAVNEFSKSHDQAITQIVETTAFLQSYIPKMPRVDRYIEPLLKVGP